MSRSYFMSGVCLGALGPGQMAPPKPRPGRPGWVTLPSGRVVTLEEWEAKGPALAFEDNPRNQAHAPRR